MTARTEPIAAPFAEATLADVHNAAAAAASAFDRWRPPSILRSSGAASQTPRDRAKLLRKMADELAKRRAEIVSTADRETALGAPRLEGELDRTTGQLRAFADLLDEGSYVQAIITSADPAAKPPRPEIRRMLVPIGLVAVFTPSNFPLAFGVAGGDTASALAAGCPVIVKGHPSHPATSELCAQAIVAAVGQTAVPPGVFSLLQSSDPAVARALVAAPEVAAVGFTGSLAAGRALFDVAAARPHPIPMYAEMGSLNPVFVAPGALAVRAKEIADGLAASMTLGTGQFCTKPGLVFAAGDDAARNLARALADKVAAVPPGTMLNKSLRENFDRLTARTGALAGVDVLTSRAAGGVVVTTTAAAFLETLALHEEHFGPFAIVVRCATPAEMLAIARKLDGQLTATIHAEPGDSQWAGELAAALVEKAGRIVWNGYPTGVAVVPAMHHGGPYPASTMAAHTSVGTTAIERFLRPVAFQNVPDALLPEALHDDNPLGIQRLVDGQWTRDKITR
jgi:NADP-dependent aldehyde dehydrogenase